MAQPVVELQNVTFGYAGVPVVENVSLHMHHGQFAGLVGPSGAGKTTLLRLILGSLAPRSGTVFVDGMDLKGKPSPCVAYVPQVETIDWNFPVTVEQVVMMGRIRRMSSLPWPSQHDKRTARDILERLEIGTMAERHIRDLSGGQQQRVFLARALLARPDLLVLDEPTAGVDLKTQENILHLLADLNREGVSILMTTHDLNSAATHLPWVFCLNRRLIASGPPERVFTEAILNETYRGNMVTYRNEGILFIAERPHHHSYHDIIPNPVPGEHDPAHQ